LEVTSSSPHQSQQGATGRLAWLFAVLAAAGAVCAAFVRPGAAGAAASQDWPPFVLVSGLVLIGLVAADDGVFEAVGRALARVAPSPIALFLGAAASVAVVTAVLNLDTSVAFLTPVLVHAARGRDADEAPLLYGCLLLSNAGSLFLPGSNLTNLIVLGHLGLTGRDYLGRMWAAALAALVVTCAVAAFASRRSLRLPLGEPPPPRRPALGLGLAAVVSAAALVLVLRSPAIPVAAVGITATGVRLATGRERTLRVVQLLGVPVLAGLFGLAVALGTVGRAWSGPATLMSHLDPWGTAAVAAFASGLVNNLPAASLLAARAPHHPFSLLVGLNLGPNMFVTGSLAWFLWIRAARSADSSPSIRQAVRIGAVAAPLSVVAAVGALILTVHTR
jgi:arsenical pump membrane protein